MLCPRAQLSLIDTSGSVIVHIHAVWFDCPPPRCPLWTSGLNQGVGPRASYESRRYRSCELTQAKLVQTSLQLHNTIQCIMSSFRAGTCTTDSKLLATTSLNGHVTVNGDVLQIAYISEELYSHTN